MIEYTKVKSAPKEICYKGEALDKIILDTLSKISSIVGATLGPGGNSVLIERYEHDLPPTLTKDGVTVFRAIGFDNSIAHVVMEMTRDAAIKTASDAGDGTSTASILAEAITRYMKEYCLKNKKVSPQKVMRYLDKLFATIIEPIVNQLSHKVKLDEEGKTRLKAVAKLSANGDEDLASSVMECFDITGDDGNVTIETYSGNSRTEVEAISGYPVAIGFEKSCKNFWPQFINDPGNQQTRLESPVFLLYNGRLTETQLIYPIMSAVHETSLRENYTRNIVVVATDFSDTVLADLAAGFPDARALNILPLIVPVTIQQGSEVEFLKDLAGITGAEIFNPLSNPLGNARIEHLGSGIEVFECSRYRSSVIGVSDEERLLIRVDEVKTQLEKSISELDTIINKERLAKLVGGIAKLKIYGSSNGETKERRDRAEDAVCAVRGAVRHGYLPGGGWTLLKLQCVLSDMKKGEATEIEEMIDILIKAFQEPFNRLVSNCGIIDKDEIFDIQFPLIKSVKLNQGSELVYDFLEHKHVNAIEAGILDSTPAVLEAIRNSLSIAGRAGTLGGVIVQRRDKEFERSEATATSSFLRMADEENPANNRP
jgi:chaperonin GroEL